jgi:cytosine/adenosine deaminase-related metal-dependent hydrolase
LYAETAALAAERNILVTTHLAESAEEMAMFRDARGPLFELLQGIGRPMGDCGQATPVALMLRAGLLNERWLVAHLNEIAPDDFALLAEGPRFHIVHCPRSHAYFRHVPFAFSKLRALGFNICLGTDSLASNDDLSLFAEMRQVRETAPMLGARKILEMATVNAAAALGEAERLGRLRSGCVADLIAVPFSGDLTRVEDEIVAFAGPVPWAMVDGRVAPATNE